MPFNPSPQVAAARDFGRKFGADLVIILHINSAKSQIGYASYGQTPGKCDLAEALAETAYDAIKKEFED